MDPELLRAICERPEDLQLRLVAADWLEERGDLDRAEFIRRECALDELPRYRLAWVRHEARWDHHRRILPLPVMTPRVRWAESPYRRGFLEALEVTDGNELLARAGALFAFAPITSLLIHAQPDMFPLDLFLAAPWLGRIRSLTFRRSEFRGDAIARLTGCEALTGLDHLGFDFHGINEYGLRALVASPLLGRLRSLSLHNNFFSDHGRPLGLFGDVAPLPRLDRLVLDGNQLYIDYLRAILGNRGLRPTQLSLSGNAMSDDGWRAVAAADLPLEQLRLVDTRGTLEGVRALIGSAHPARLRSLDLGHNELDRLAAAALAGGTWPQLETLAVGWNRFGAAGFDALARGDRWPQLDCVDAREHDHDEVTARRAAAWLDSTAAMRAV